MPSLRHPVAISIAHWQWGSLRIAPSFLLGWLQATFGVDWSYQIYPATLSLALVCGALAVGGTVRAVWPNQRQAAWWAALTVGTTLNGFVYGATSGFYPQTLGLAFAITALALRGMEIGTRTTVSVTSATSFRAGLTRNLRASLPTSVCLGATLYCYPEICPFLAAAVGASYLLPWPTGAVSWRARLGSLGSVLLVSAALTAPEVGRAVRALRNQASVVTGYPVPGSPLSFLAHALGGRSGPTDAADWFYEGGWARLLSGAPAVLCFLLLLIWAERQRRGDAAKPIFSPRPICRWSALVPNFLLATICVAALLYFRWFVANPWPQAAGAIGQTFSQYKLSLWASLALLAAAITMAIRVTGHRRVVAIACLAGLCALGVGRTNDMLPTWANPIILASGAKQDPFGSYRAFCEALSSRPASETFYLIAANDYFEIKQRQLLAYFLADRELLGNWQIDGYINVRWLGMEAHDSAQDADWVVSYQPINHAQAEAPTLCRLTVARPNRDGQSAP